jgi:uncharacterized protein with FMN-binding domain
MKKIALSLFVIAASAAYVLAQPGGGGPADVVGPRLPADDVATGSIGARDADAVRGRQGAPQPLPPAVPSPIPTEDHTAIPVSQAGESEADDEAASLPSPTARVLREPPPLRPAQPEPPTVASADPRTLPPAPAASAAPPAAAAIPAAAPPPEPALTEIPLPRPRPDYRIVRPRIIPASAAQTIAVAAARSGYADGTYTGPAVDAYYGLVQIQAVVQGGRLASIEVLRYPSDRRTSVFINRHALPLLRDEVIRAQSAHVDIVSGATLTSRAFMRSLDGALRQANA